MADAGGKLAGSSAAVQAGDRNDIVKAYKRASMFQPRGNQQSLRCSPGTREDRIGADSLPIRKRRAMKSSSVSRKSVRTEPTIEWHEY